MAHLIIHCCIHLCKSAGESTEHEEQKRKAKERIDDRAAERKCAKVKEILEKSSKAKLSAEDRAHIDRFWADVNSSNFVMNSHASNMISLILEKNIKEWTDISETIKSSPEIGNLLYRISNLQKRIECFKTLNSNLQNDHSVAWGLVRDPIESMPHLFKANLVNDTIALVALKSGTFSSSSHSTILRDDRRVIWETYLPSEIRARDEIIEASVLRSGFDDCCCPTAHPLPNWGENMWARRDIVMTRSSCETTYLQRCCCCFYNACKDVQEIASRKEQLRNQESQQEVSRPLAPVLEMQ